MGERNMAFTSEQIADLEKNMKRARSIHKAAEKGALETCNAGEYSASGDLWEINSLAAQIMSVGRRMRDQEGTFVALSSGDK